MRVNILLPSLKSLYEIETTTKINSVLSDIKNCGLINANALNMFYFILLCDQMRAGESQQLLLAEVRWLLRENFISRMCNYKINFWDSVN